MAEAAMTRENANTIAGQIKVTRQTVQVIGRDKARRGESER